MYISKIKLYNYRNYIEQEINLDKGVNVFYGLNGEGKTNILEAVYLNAIGKSFRTSKDKELINFNKELAKTEIEYVTKKREGKINITISDKKDIILNGIKVNRLSEFLGNINIVLFNPDDILILKKGPGERRRFLDVMISQLRPKYVYYLSQYKKILEQRNIYLRQENKNYDLLDIWDEKLVTTGKEIQNYRNEFIEKIKEKINNTHKNITDEKEEIKIKYLSNLNENKLKEARNEDIERGYTSIGVHRDDFLVYINGKMVNQYGSQGQNRTAILSLKLSELEIVYEEIGEYPILLLDDFMSELDGNRRKKLLENIRETQVLITCTEKIEIDKFPFKMFNIKDGELKECIYTSEIM